METEDLQTGVGVGIMCDGLAQIQMTVITVQAKRKEERNTELSGRIYI